MRMRGETSQSAACINNVRPPSLGNSARRSQRYGIGLGRVRWAQPITKTTKDPQHQMTYIYKSWEEKQIIGRQG